MNLDLQVGVLPEALAQFEDNTFHACLADTPYGLSDDPPPELITAWLAGEEPRGRRGFLGRTWDGMPPGPRFWRELLRVMRPGATVIAFGGDRTFGLQDIAMRFGGFEILPAFAWLHAEAQAHGGNVGKLADKAAGAEREVVGSRLGLPGVAKDGRNQNPSRYQSLPGRGTVETSSCDITAPATPLAKLWDGHASRLRGNWEPICVGVKPFDGTLAENAARWGVAGFDVEGGRVPTAGAEDDAALAAIHSGVVGFGHGRGLTGGDPGVAKQVSGYSPNGRYPSTVLLEHSPDCHPDRCVPECPAAVLKEQGERAGVHRPGRGGSLGPEQNVQGFFPLTEGKRSGRRRVTYYADKGAPSDPSRYYFQARPARRERSAGCEGLFWRRAPGHPDGWELCSEADDYAREKDGSPLGNPHGSIKSLELTRYLAKLLLQPGPDAKVLVPFSGSGSEDIGAMLAGWPHVVAIEQSAQWVEVNRRRAEYWRPIAEGQTTAPIGNLLDEDPRQGSLWT